MTEIKQATPQATDVKGLAKAIGVSQRTAWSIVSNRQIDHFRVGRSVRIPLCAIDEFIKKRTIEAV